MTDERSKQPPGDDAQDEDTPRAPANPFAAARPPGRISLGNLPKVPRPSRPSTAPLPSLATRTAPGEPEGLEEDSGDLPTGNLAADALPDLDLMRIGASASWDDDTHDASEAPPLAAPSLADESRDAMPISLGQEAASDIDGGFEDEHTVMIDAEFDEPVGLASHTDVEDVEDIADADLVELPDDIDPTTNIPQEDVQEALRRSGAFGQVAREDVADELEPEPTQMSWTPGPAPSPDAAPRGPRTQLGIGAVRAPQPAPAPSAVATDLTEEVAAPLDLAEGPGFEVQATEILDSVFENEAVAPKLKLNQGPAAGQEYFARELRVTVGRGENNTIQLPDPALSRTHFEIVKNPDESFTLRDLDSANGTYLNGQRIKEASLFDGDSIEVGKSVAIFVCAAAPPRSYRHLVPAATETVAGAPPPIDEHTRLATLEFDKSTQLFTRITLAAGAIASVFIVALIALIATRGPDAQAETGQPRAAAVEVDDTRVKAQELYLQGVEAVKARDWASARAKFDAAHAVDPSLEVAPQLQRIESESEARDLLEQARKLAEQDDVDGARAVVAKIPETSSYYEEASALVRQNKGAELSELLAQAQAQFTADELEASLATLDGILAREPDHAGAKDLRPRVLERQAELERQAAAAAAAAAAARKAEANDAPDPFARNTRPRKTGTKPKKSGGKSKDDQAAAHAERGLKLLRAKKYKEARRALIDGEKISKSHPKVRDLSKALDRMAKSLYIKAANKKKTDPEAAADLCRTIMRMVPSSSSSWQRAKKLLTTLN